MSHSEMDENSETPESSEPLTDLTSGTKITVTCGANTQDFELAGRTVADLLGNVDLTRALNIPEGASAKIDGEDVATDDHAETTVEAGQTVEFYKASGSKS